MYPGGQKGPFKFVKARFMWHSCETASGWTLDTCWEYKDFNKKNLKIQMEMEISSILSEYSNEGNRLLLI